MTKRQTTISNKNHKLAVEYFKFNGEWFEGCHLHHINPDWKENDIERYIQWNPRDLQVLTIGEHTTIHNMGKQYHLGKTHSEETKRKISESMKGVNHKGENNPMYGRHWKLVDGKRIYY